MVDMPKGASMQNKGVVVVEIALLHSKPTFKETHMQCKGVRVNKGRDAILESPRA